MTVGFLLKGESTMLIAFFIVCFLVVSALLMYVYPADKPATPVESNVAYAARLQKQKEDHEAWVSNVNFPWQG
jgi:hypothetical protein